MRFILALIPGFIIASVVIFSLANAHPFPDEPSNHISEIKKIPEVRTLFDIYGNNVNEPFAVNDSSGRYSIVFTAKTGDTSSRLEIYYFAWSPFSTIYTCANLDSGKTYIGNEVRDTFDLCNSNA